MLKIASFILLFSVVIFSCQKNSDTQDPGNGLLKKIVRKNSTDSVTSEYFYSAAGKLTREKITGNWNGGDRGDDVIINRGSNGILVQTIEKAPFLSTSGIDSATTLFDYDGVSNRYKYSVLRMTQGATSIMDSVIFDYDANGRIIRNNHYEFITGSPMQQLKQEFVYGPAGNLDSIKNLTYSSGSFSLQTVIAYSYDAKANPLILSNEAILLYRFENFGPNNVIQTQVVYINSPSQNSSINVVLNYNSLDKPVTGSMNEMPGNINSTLAYFYD